MADSKVEYLIEILKRGAGATEAAADLGKVDQKAKAAGKTMAAFGRDVKAAFAAVAGTALLHGAINEFIESEQAANRLNAALRAQGRFTAELSREYRQLAEALSQVTLFSDEDITNVIAKLIAFGATKDQIKPLTEIVLDVSTLMERDLPRAAVAMGQALRGNFDAFRQLGIEIDDTKTQTEQWNEMLEKLAKAAGGQATEAVKGMSGEILLLKKNIKEAKEEIGGFFAGLYNWWVGDAAAAIGESSALEQTRQSINNVKQSYLAMADAIAKVILEQQRLGSIRLIKSSSGEEKLRGPISEIEAGRMLGMLGLIRQNLREVNSTGPYATSGVAANILESELPAIERAIRKLQAELGVTLARPGAGTPSRASMMAGTPAPAIFSDSEIDEADAILKEFNDRRAREESDREKTITQNARRDHEMRMNFIEQEREAQDQLTQAGLAGRQKEMVQAEANHQQRIRDIQKLTFEDEDRYNTLIELENQLHSVEQERIRKSHDANEQFKVELGQMGQQAKVLFADGLSGAMVNAFEDGNVAFEKFAKNYLQTISKMILQAVLLRAINAGIVALFGGAGDGPQYSSAGQYQGSFSGASNSQLNSLGYSERSVVGIQESIGKIGASKSIVNKGGPVGDGRIEITVRFDRGTEGEVINKAVEQARVRVERDLQQDSGISQATKRLVT